MWFCFIWMLYSTLKPWLLVICCFLRWMKYILAVSLGAECPFVLLEHIHILSFTVFSFHFSCAWMNMSLKSFHTNAKVISHMITMQVLSELWSVQWWKHFKMFYNMSEKDSKLQLFFFFSLEGRVSSITQKLLMRTLYKKKGSSCKNINGRC